MPEEQIRRQGMGTDKKWVSLLSDVFSKDQQLKDVDRYSEDMVNVFSSFKRQLDDAFNTRSGSTVWAKVHEVAKQDNTVPEKIMFAPRGIAGRAIPELLEYQATGGTNDPVKSNLTDHYHFEQNSSGLIIASQKTVSLEE